MPRCVGEVVWGGVGWIWRDKASSIHVSCLLRRSWVLVGDVVVGSTKCAASQRCCGVDWLRRSGHGSKSRNSSSSPPPRWID